MEVYSGQVERLGFTAGDDDPACADCYSQAGEIPVFFVPVAERDVFADPQIYVRCSVCVDGTGGKPDAFSDMGVEEQVE